MYSHEMHVSKRHLTIVAVVAMALLAGCSAMQPGGTAGDSSSSSDLPDSVAYPDGYSEQRVPTNGSAINTHYAALENESYRVAFIRGSASGTLAVNQSANKALVQYSTEQASVDVYVENGTAYQQATVGNNTTYRKIDATTAQIRQQIALPAISQTYRLLNYSDSSVTRHNGAPVNQYNVTGMNTSINSSADLENVSDVNGTLEVAADGRIVDYRWNGTYNDVRSEYRYTITESGDVQVEEPEWTANVSETPKK